MVDLAGASGVCDWMVCAARATKPPPGQKHCIGKTVFVAVRTSKTGKTTSAMTPKRPLRARDTAVDSTRSAAYFGRCTIEGGGCRYCGWGTHSHSFRRDEYDGPEGAVVLRINSGCMCTAGSRSSPTAFRKKAEPSPAFRVTIRENLGSADPPRRNVTPY